MGGGFWGTWAPGSAGLTCLGRQQLSSRGHAVPTRPHPGPSCGETERTFTAARAPQALRQGLPLGRDGGTAARARTWAPPVSVNTGLLTPIHSRVVYRAEERPPESPEYPRKTSAGHLVFISRLSFFPLCVCFTVNVYFIPRKRALSKRSKVRPSPACLKGSDSPPLEDPLLRSAMSLVPWYWGSVSGLCPCRGPGGHLLSHSEEARTGL